MYIEFWRLLWVAICLIILASFLGAAVGVFCWLSKQVFDNYKAEYIRKKQKYCKHLFWYSKTFCRDCNIEIDEVYE